MKIVWTLLAFNLIFRCQNQVEEKPIVQNVKGKATKSRNIRKSSLQEARKMAMVETCI